ncbi:transglutaminase [Saccharobesus litoralis]|uniref:Transglutaminase n=1 Tax=Saccharobesus litoralis TaxID=2172099 RepID=A0A2S0VX59_9ALTE|nr:transglutaminase family protein [Saccharobesus litoralis]AWB68791.1 transglutaminase [Saccharobesus litoralis]
MIFNVKHVTTYTYSDMVSLCQNQARLTPMTVGHQVCHASEIHVSPAADYKEQFVDYFGNQVTVFDVPTQHNTLQVTAISTVELLPRSQDDLFNFQIPWESVRDSLRRPHNSELLNAAEYVLPSGFVQRSSAMKQFALQSFTANRAIVDACQHLMARIFNEFTFDPSFSTISTPLSEVLEHKKGVCQDFAHFAIACIRSIGLAARYVSGYIETLPPEGQEKLEGADATHAWFAVYIPNFGWLEFDPTNNLIPEKQHITLAVGRDFADVSPLKGVAFGGGEHQLQVAVDMMRMESLNM